MPTSSRMNNAPTGSLLTESNTRPRGFLPYEYRTAKTLESIRQERAYRKALRIQSTVSRQRPTRLSIEDDLGNSFNHSISHRHNS
jgi:hypothetical protein